jgi:acyl-CoA synthetase (AMP-forming)/AMP-acid ligase II
VLTASAFSGRIRELSVACANHRAFRFEDRWYDWSLVRDIGSGIEAMLKDWPGATVGLVLRERPSTAAALLAAWSLNRTAVLFSPHLPDEALAADVGEARPALLLADDRDWPRAGLAAQRRAPGIGAAAVCDERGSAVGSFRPLAEPGPAVRPAVALAPGAAVTVLTSGTTGRPKRIAVSYADLESARDRVTVRPPRHRREVTINVLPLTTIGGIRGLAETVWRGRPLALMERFDVWQWARLVRDHAPRRVGVPPAVLRTILDERIPAGWFEGVECLQTGSAPLHLPTVREFVEAYGVPVLNAYGSTEFGGRVAQWTLADWEQWYPAKLGSVGRPMEHVTIRIVDPEGAAELPRGRVGLLEVRPRGPGPPVRTNDLARLDDDGFLWIEGRADDVIIRGGFKVPAAEVEEVLEQHPAVREAVVVGLPDERLGQVPAAAVTLRDRSGRVSGDDLVRWVRDHLVPYKAPRVVRVIDAIPRNAMHKPLRREVQAMLADESTANHDK